MAKRKNVLSDVLANLQKIANGGAGQPSLSPEEEAMLANQQQAAQMQNVNDAQQPPINPEEEAALINQAQEQEAIVANAQEEQAITEAAQTLVAAEEDKQSAIATLKEVANAAFAAEDAAIAKEASLFGAYAGASMAQAYYDTMAINTNFDYGYNSGYSIADDFITKEAAINYAIDNFDDIVLDSKQITDNYIGQLYKQANDPEYVINFHYEISKAAADDFIQKTMSM